MLYCWSSTVTTLQEQLFCCFIVDNTSVQIFLMNVELCDLTEIFMCDVCLSVCLSVHHLCCTVVLLFYVVLWTVVMYHTLSPLTVLNL